MDKAAIGARIREARGISGMTQEQLAEKFRQDFGDSL